MIHITPGTVLLVMAGLVCVLAFVWLAEIGLIKTQEDDDRD